MSKSRLFIKKHLSVGHNNSQAMVSGGLSYTLADMNAVFLALIRGNSELQVAKQR